PVLGIAVVLAGLRIPKAIASCLEMIGSATFGVAVFTVGLTLAAHSFHLTKGVVLAALGRITVQTALLFAAPSASCAKPVRARGVGLLQFSIGDDRCSACRQV
ncbi:MAG: AEC family transporter, partial [Candidatus Acidiferrum sp.]